MYYSNNSYLIGYSEQATNLHYYYCDDFSI